MWKPGVFFFFHQIFVTENLEKIKNPLKLEKLVENVQ